MDSKFFKCECNHGGLHVSYDKTFGLEFAHLVRDPYVRKWSHRIAQAWAALRGKPWQDMVILNDAQIADLADYLVASQNQTSDERYAEQLEKIELSLFCNHCETSVDGILQWANSSDCSRRAKERLKQSL